MLVLTRKRTEMIKIGEDVVITVVHTSRGSVKLGIQAPANVRVLRAELDSRPAVSPEPAEAAVSEEELVELPLNATDSTVYGFDADYLADMEDQALLCLAH